MDSFLWDNRSIVGTTILYRDINAARYGTCCCIHMLESRSDQAIGCLLPVLNIENVQVDTGFQAIQI